MTRGEINMLSYLAKRAGWYRALSVSNRQACLGLYRRGYVERRLVPQPEPGGLRAFEYKAFPETVTEARKLGTIK